MTRVRLDGWRTIAAHLGRARSTVIRWADTDGLPVHRIGGRENASVFAYADELDDWLARHEPDPAAEPAPAAQPDGAQPQPATPHPARVRWPGAVIAGAAVVAVLVLVAALVGPGGSHGARRAGAGPDLPADPADARLYLKARDDWAQRTPASLHSAITEFGQLIAREPRYAPGYAGLADAWISSREFDSVPSPVALAKARAAASAALALEPSSAEAQRALGFVAWYDRRDQTLTRRYFAAAIALAPSDAQTHFWYGNILADAGDLKGGLAELGAARRLNPGSAPIEADYDFTFWQVDPAGPAVADLQALAAAHPDFSSPRVFLSLIDLARDDPAGYLTHRRQLAQIVADPHLSRRVAVEAAAFARGGGPALLAEVASMGVGDFTNWDRFEWPATAAAMTGRRATLLAALAGARSVDESFTPWRPDQKRLAPWLGDPEVLAALKAVRALDSDQPDPKASVALRPVGARDGG